MVSPEQFLISQFRIQLESNKKLSKQTERFKKQAEIHVLHLWNKSQHRADEAIRQGLAHAKLGMNKKK